MMAVPPSVLQHLPSRTPGGRALVRWTIREVAQNSSYRSSHRSNIHGMQLRLGQRSELSTVEYLDWERRIP
jgi:hypothetical protein